MQVRIAHKIVIRLFMLLILTASLTMNVPVSATSSELLNQEQQSGSAPANQESTPRVDDRPSSPRLAALWDRLKAGDRDALDSF